MTEQERIEMAERLQSLRTELLQLIEGAREQSKPVSLEEPIGRLSRMDAMQQQEMAGAQLRLARQRLAAIDQALKRVALETYGDCVLCGDEIDVRRLRVKPEGALCLTCQKSRET